MSTSHLLHLLAQFLDGQATQSECIRTRFRLSRHNLTHQPLLDEIGNCISYTLPLRIAVIVYHKLATVAWVRESCAIIVSKLLHRFLFAWIIRPGLRNSMSMLRARAEFRMACVHGVEPLFGQQPDLRVNGCCVVQRDLFRFRVCCFNKTYTPCAPAKLHT